MTDRRAPHHRSALDQSVADKYGERAAAALLDLLDFTGMSERLVARGRDAFDMDEALQLAAEAIASRLAAAVSRLSSTFVDEHPEVEWRKIRGMRNIVTHDYGRIDYEIVWAALAERVPELRVVVQQLLGSVT